MASANEILRRLESVTKITTLREMVYDEIKAEEELLKNIKEEEFKVGDIYGNSFRTQYKDFFYAEYKNAKNPRAGFGNVDLINTGSFIESFRLNKPTQNKYKWGATDRKRNILVEMYGEGIMGMNQETFKKFQLEVVKPRFVKKLQRIITG
jgi:hypothetical protein